MDRPLFPGTWATNDQRTAQVRNRYGVQLGWLEALEIIGLNIRQLYSCLLYTSDAADEMD